MLRGDWMFGMSLTNRVSTFLQDLTGGADLVEAQKTAVVAAQVMTILRHLPVMAISGVMIALITAYVAWDHANFTVFAIWLGGFVCLEAVMLAGGFQDNAARGEVVILRRARNGGVMMRVVNLRELLRGDGGGDPIPLRRHDIIFVPRTTVSEVTLWVEQYVYGILPLDQAFSYAIANAINDR